MQLIEKIDEKIEKIQSKTILSLSVAILLGLAIRFYFTPWELPTNSFDSFILMIEGIAHSQGDFTELSHRSLWPLFLSGFFSIIPLENYFEYMTAVRIISISISIITIPIIYLISKEFVKEKYAILATFFFTLESNLIENSIFGQTEPLFILIGLLSFYFILQKNYRYYLLAFVFAGLAFDTRVNGIVLFLLIICALAFKIKSKKEFGKKILFGIIIFSIIIGPTHIIQPILQDEPIFPFIKTVSETISEDVKHYSVFESSEKRSPIEIIFNALKNEFLHIFRISIPFLIIFIPIGIIVSLKKFEYKEKILFSVVLISLLIAVFQYTVSNEFRNLFFLIPFFCIFSVIGIEKLTKKIELNNLFLILLLGGLILLSANFLNDRNNIDKEYFLEKDDFGKYIVNNYEGNITGNMRLEIIRNMHNLDTSAPHFENDKIAFFDPGTTITSMLELMKYSNENKIEYLLIEENVEQKHFLIFKKILVDKDQYNYLEEKFDSNELDYKKFKAKIFKINWNMYNEI